MAAIKKKDLAAMSNEELNTKLVELKTDLMKENSQIAIGTIPKSPGLLKTIKKTIARINSILKQRERKQKK